MHLQKTAYNSALRAYSPQSKLITGLALLLACLLLDSAPVSLAVIAAVGAVNVALGRIPLIKYIGLLSIPLGFLILGAVTIVFGRAGLNPAQNAAIMSANIFGTDYAVTRASLYAGVSLILRSLGAVSCMYFIALNTYISDISAALISFKFPRLLITLMELVYRYIFVIFDEMARMKTAQDSRLGYLGFKTGLSSLGRLLGSLFIRTLNRCDNMYNALASRGFKGEIPMLERSYKDSRPVWLFGALGCVGLCALRFLEVRG